MSNQFQPLSASAIIHHLPGVSTRAQEGRRAVYEANRDRVFSFAFWMTDSEQAAEALSERTFLRAFSFCEQPSEEAIDRALVLELRREGVDLALPPCLRCDVVRECGGIRRNTKRVELERAIVQLPYTERMIFCMHDGDGYPHARIARTLGISEEQSRNGLHQARLRIREIVSLRATAAA